MLRLRADGRRCTQLAAPHNDSSRTPEAHMLIALLTVPVVDLTVVFVAAVVYDASAG
ncbi:hypothetical protein [Streptomyces sp. NBC_00829]|uniref:hypothetical protein n=1 Tax=Streptomyces sp. NBC_00829 TaxID=2903679 RepID=UPI00386FFCFC|nr:hypothetical protein OG293_38245 [Streptomyces sp. NBC_00829]